MVVQMYVTQEEECISVLGPDFAPALGFLPGDSCQG